MAEAPQAPPPTLAEASGWLDFEVDDRDSARIGRVLGLFADAEDGAPAWLVVAIGRRRWLRGRREGRPVAVPLRECAGAAGRLWVAETRAALDSAPTVDPARPLLREHELTIGAHYGIDDRAGRCAEVAGRPTGAVTARPLGV